MYHVRTLLIFITFVSASHAQIPDFSTPVTYDKARQWAISRDPRLDLALESVESADGQVEQASLPPNPVFGFEMENFWGSGPFDGAEGIEITMAASQVIETGDKRTRRTALAQREKEMIEWHREAVIAGIDAKVRAAFAQTLLALEQMDLRREQLALSHSMEFETSQLVEATRATQVQLIRAQLAVRQKEIALLLAERDYFAACQLLAIHWGHTVEEIFNVEGELLVEPSLPPVRSFYQQITSTAALAQYDAMSRTRAAALDLEKAQAAPDLEVFAGGRYFNEGEGDYAFVAGFEIPIPIFDRNQGNIRSARANLRAVEHEREAARRNIYAQVSEAYLELSAAHIEAFAMQSELMETAEQALKETEAGYERGQYTQLEVLESKQTLLEIRETYLDALSRYVLAKAKIEGLTRPAQIQ